MKRWCAIVAVVVMAAAGCGDADAGGPGGPTASAGTPTGLGLPTDGAADPWAVPCPPEGYRILQGQENAAMGLRVVGIDLYNCGKKPIRLHGHPELTLLGDDGVRADVEVRHGSAGVTGLPSFDAAPRPVTVRPHGTASSGLVWRLLVEAGAESVTVDRVVVGPAPGLAPQRIDGLHVDVGTTRLVGLSPWRAHER